MIKPFRKINTNDLGLMQLQTNVYESLSPLSRLPLLNGTLLEAVSLSTSDTQVEHKLGRKPLGWLLVDIDADATVFRTAAFNEQFITLQSSAAVTCNIWVF